MTAAMTAMPGSLASDIPVGSAAGADAAAVTAPGDEELVEQLRDGSAAAGEQLVQRYFQPLMRYLMRIVGSDHLAEELHQQTWLSVLDHLDKFDGKSGSAGGSGGGAVSGGFKAWLFRIATNKANDHWRSAGRERVAKEGLKRIADETAPHAGHRLEGAEQEQKLLVAIEKLPEAQRQVLMLRYYSNLKFVEIAELLGCPLNTALGRMHKATIKLKQLMEA
jgi:RNA polymerase sigma-70 factor (ECF subfamily)